MTTELEALSARVQRLEDLEAVRATWLNYCNRLDAFDYDRLGDVFSEDAALEVSGLSPGLDGSYAGRHTIIEDFYRKTDVQPSADVRVGLMTGHLSTNMQIELHGDEATTLASFFEIVDDNLVLIGTYQHRMRRGPMVGASPSCAFRCAIAAGSRSPRPAASPSPTSWPDRPDRIRRAAAVAWA